MKHLFRLVWVNYKYCFLRILEFKEEVFSWSLNSLLWAFLSLVVVELLFGQIDSIAGWTKNETLVLSVVGSMFNSALWWFIIPSVLLLSKMIRTGHFDFYLLKPVDSQFLASISRFEFDNYPRVFAMIFLLFKFVPQTQALVGLGQIVGFISLFILGLIIFYSLFFIITSLCFWLVGLEALEDLFDTMVTMGRYPTNMFGGALRILFFFIVPMAFVATFPVQVLLGKSGVELVILGGIVATTFLFFSHWFWNFALKHYSSASS